MCISVLKRQITSYEVIALGKVYLTKKTKKEILAKNLPPLQLLLKGTSVFMNCMISEKQFQADDSI